MLGLVRFLCRVQRGERLMSHDGQPYLYAQGAFFGFIGLLPESLPSRRKNIRAVCRGRTSVYLLSVSPGQMWDILR